MRVGRLKRGADIQRLLGTPVKQRSTHFALHHVGTRDGLLPSSECPPTAPNLSTAHAQTCSEAVDESGSRQGQVLDLGCLVPKRHARRAVTRSLLKRQMRVAAERLAGQLPSGLALLRLRQPFPTRQFPSARSEALQKLVRSELDALLQRFVVSARASAAAAASLALAATSVAAPGPSQ